MLASQLAALIVFVATIVGVVVLVLYPQQLRIPGTEWRVGVRYWIVPVVGCLIMLACGSLNGSGVVTGILGDDQIQPYSIAILFMSLAYISSSLDSTGAFAWLGLHIIRASKGRGRLLYILYFLLSSTITLVTSSDIVTMTLTPIIMYCSAATGVDPLPFLAAEFAAANLWSMAIYIGNTTNVIVAQAHHMTFLGFSKWMLLPTIGSGVVCLLQLLAVHHAAIPNSLTIPALTPRVMLSDRFGALFGTTNALGCLALLAAGSNLGWPIWGAALACAGLHFVYNFVAYVLLHQGRPGELEVHATPGHSMAGCRRGKSTKEKQPTDEADADLVADVLPSASVPAACSSQPAAEPVDHQVLLVQTTDCPTQCGAAAAEPYVQLQHHQPAALCGGHQPALPALQGCPSQLQHTCQQLQPETSVATAAAAGTMCTAVSSRVALPSPISGAAEESAQQPASPASASTADGTLQIRRPSFWLGIWQQPWEVVPFILGMFVLVEALAMAGWVDMFGGVLGACCSAGAGAAVFCTGAVGVVLANLISNQPMTIFMTRVLVSDAFKGAVQDERVRQGAAFALVAGSNLAANFTLLGSLAGIMWVVILKRQGLQGFGYLPFLRALAPLGLVGLVVTLLLLWLELAVFP